ncbi:MAG TPA: methyltransferase [Sulfurimonas sp. UBA12504]|nr:MAG TPA: methyltransferase [Sulfurimonas sp. UBA12504]
MEVINRTKCEITGSNDLELLHTLKNFPVYMGTILQDRNKDLVADMCWSISKSSGLVELNKLIPLEILYPENHAGAVGGTWDSHHDEFAKFLNQYVPKGIIEIGGAHGILSKKYQKYSEINWTIVEPNPIPIEGVKAKFIKCFFDDTFTFEEDYDTIVHSHVFEHIYHPDTFIGHLSSFMTDGKNLLFSIPNMQVMLERKYTNCINFEHTIFLTEPYIEYLLAKYGFKIDKKEYFMDDHSIFYGVIKDSTIESIVLDKKLYEKNKKLYLDYVDYHEKLVEELNKKIRQTNSPLYLFGAHVFAQYLIAFGLGMDNIICLLDNDSNKQGRRLYGTDKQVQSPKILKEVKNPIVILKAGVYNNEIKKDILENINAQTEFWE